MAKAVKSGVVAVGLLSGALMFSATAGAQEPTPQCNGKDATIVKTEWTPADFDAQTSFDDEVYGPVSPTPPFVVGTPGNDVIVVSPADDADGDGVSVWAREGNDTICLIGDGTPGALVYGGSGDDLIFNGLDNSRSTIVTILGGLGNDTLHGAPGGDLIVGGPGNDTIFGYGGSTDDGAFAANILAGEDGNDVIRGGRGVDLIVGGAGDDTIYGAESDDQLYGGPGRDTLFGGAGADLLASNDDFLGVHESGEPAFDGPGSFDLSTTSFSLDTAGSRMFGGPGPDLLIGSNRWDRMQGGPGDDLMLGMEGRDWMRGGPGNDMILGGANGDDINGNQGVDSIVIDGADTGQGGYGQDTCVNLVEGADIPILSCERTGTPTAQWGDLIEELNLEDWTLAFP